MANPSTVPNTSFYTGWLHDPLRRPEDIRALSIDNIIVGKRERGLDYEKIRGLANSIKTEGLLQPIGVRRTDVYNKYDLIYGYHRIAACSMLHKEDPTEGRIVAVIFPKEMPDWACKLAEIAENLARIDLKQNEKEAQTVIYSGLLKKHKLIDEANTRRTGRPTIISQSDSPTDLSKTANKPTLVEKVTQDLGIHKDTFHQHVTRAKAIAQKAGLRIPRADRGPEKLSGDELIAIGEKAAQATEEQRAEALKDLPRQVSQRQSETETKVFLDIIDPAPFIKWCRERIKGQHKPMSVDILKAYRKALDELIAEIETMSH